MHRMKQHPKECELFGIKVWSKARHNIITADIITTAKCPKCKIKFASITLARKHYTRLCGRGWVYDRTCKACKAIKQRSALFQHNCAWATADSNPKPNLQIEVFKERIINKVAEWRPFTYSLPSFDCRDITNRKTHWHQRLRKKALPPLPAHCSPRIQTGAYLLPHDN